MSYLIYHTAHKKPSFKIVLYTGADDFPSDEPYKIYNTYQEAEEKKAELESLYKQGFYRSPFVSLKTLLRYKDDMVEIEDRIKEGLKNYDNFLGIDFCDVNCNGIQVRGHHKEITSHTYGVQPTLRYDFTNKEEVINDFIEMWKENDVPEEVESYKRFLDFGKKYGWD